jgi:hypothetical protein
MNTLNFKALLIRTVLVVFVRAIVIYLLATIPVMAVLPIMYLMSAGFALSFGWIAAILFLLLFYLVKKMRGGLPFKIMLLYLSAAASVVVAFQIMEITGAEENIWSSGIFLLFPALAIISGWISLLIGKQKINYLLSFTTQVNDETGSTHFLPSPENIFKTPYHEL